jgi:carbon storage regulator
MLVLTRKVGERIRIGENVVITVVRIHGTAVRLGVEAPLQMTVVRQELAERTSDEARATGEPAAETAAS